jgi:filamentous hemagglutinin family protein
MNINKLIILIIPSIALGQLPVINNIESGQAVLSTNANNMHIEQTTNKAIINWESFNVSSDSSVHFQQPNSTSTTLNRINGMYGQSVIAGNLTSNGQIILSNTSGILFTPTATIDVNGLIATTANLNTQDFLNNQLKFNTNSNNNAIIHNQGFIFAADQGLVALVAPHVINDGIIVARQGNIILANSNNFTIDLYGDDLIHFADTPINSSITQTGAIFAHKGLITLSNQQAKSLSANTVNLANHKYASNAYQRGGKIILSSKGSIKHSGHINAGNYQAGSGGLVKLSAPNITINGGSIDASGIDGGGQIYLGGLWQGASGIPYANYLLVDSSSIIFNNAINHGNGGTVVLWSDQLTDFQGIISAQGGAFSGNGGNVEVSSTGQLKFNGAVNTSALYGDTGLLLLDPADIHIVSTDTLHTDSTTNSGTTTMNPNSTNTSYIKVSDITNALLTNNVTITNTSTDNLYDIYLDTILEHNTLMNTTLSLIADRNINLNSNIQFSSSEGDIPTLKLLLAAPNGEINLNPPGIRNTIMAAQIDLNSPVINGPMTIMTPFTTVSPVALNNVYNGISTINNISDQNSAAINFAPINKANSLIINNFTIDTNNTNRGIYLTGNLIINDSIISNNYTPFNGAAIFGNSNDLTITANNNQFINNTSNGSGGAIYLKNTNFTSNNNIFTNNQAIVGGAIFAIENSDLKLVNNQFNSNYVDRYGAAVYLAASDFISSNNIFKNNQADFGGAIFAIENSDLKLVNNQFNSNYVDRYGAALYITDSNITSYKSIFHENTANNLAGVIFLRDGIFISDNDIFSSNQSSRAGAVYLVASDFISSNNIFKNNQANLHGGAIYALYGSNIESTNDQFIANTTNLQEGGAISIANGTFNFSNNKFEHNYAKSYGGAIYAENSILSSNSNYFYKNTATNSGGAIALEQAPESSINSKIEDNNSTFQENAAQYGAAFNLMSPGITIKSTNSNFNNNAATKSGNVVYTDINNSIDFNEVSINKITLPKNTSIERYFKINTSGKYKYLDNITVNANIRSIGIFDSIYRRQLNLAFKLSDIYYNPKDIKYNFNVNYPLINQTQLSELWSLQKE